MSDDVKPAYKSIKQFLAIFLKIPKKLSFYRKTKNTCIKGKQILYNISPFGVKSISANINTL